MPAIEAHADRDQLAASAASIVAEGLSGPGRVSFVAAGGSTPAATYDRLSAMDLGWSRVTVTLTDERWVSSGSPEANARLIGERLLVGPAASARFLPLTGQAATPEAEAMSIEPAVRALAPFEVVLLGMGEDGHVASMFPGAANLAAMLDLNGQRFAWWRPKPALPLSCLV